MPAGNFLIIAITLVLVLGGGLAVFFWWRSKYGVWARQRREREQTREGPVTVIRSDPVSPWTATGAQPGGRAPSDGGTSRA